MPPSKQEPGGRNVPPRSSRYRIALAALVAASLLLPGRADAHGAFHEEVIRVDALLREAPTDAGLWQQRGWLYFYHGDWQQALLDAEKAERFAPGRLPTGYLTGKALVVGAKLDAARSVLDDYVKLHPQHADAWLERSRVLRRLGLFDESLSDLRTALAKTPTPEPDLYLELAQALAERSRDDEAVQVLDQGIAKLGNVPSLGLKVIMIETERGKIDRALERIELMQKTAPRPEPWLAERARALSQAGRMVESRTGWLALADRIESLPDSERGSHAMSTLLEQARRALAALEDTSTTSSTASAAGSR